MRLELKIDLTANQFDIMNMIMVKPGHCLFCGDAFITPNVRYLILQPFSFYSRYLKTMKIAVLCQNCANELNMTFKKLKAKRTGAKK